MKNTYKRELKYIYWGKESPMIKVSQEEFQRIYSKFKELGRDMKNQFKIDREMWMNCKLSYRVTKKGDWLQLYTREDENGVGIYRTYTTNTIDENKNIVQTTGKSGLSILRSYFEQANNVTLCKAFGTVEVEVKYCVPRQFAYYIDKETIYEHASSIDGCSQYPSNMCGRLPDSHTAKQFKGTVEPTEEYPFAFYIKSGHSAEYGVYDTHAWKFENKTLLKHLFTEQQPYWIDPEDDITVLMKASQYELTESFKHFYELRKVDEEAKLVMNKAIGCMHRREYNKDKYGHLATVCIARSNNRILEYIHKIGFRNIIQICVDGILYKGGSRLGVDFKALGAMHQEFTDCVVKYKHLNCYIAKDNETIVKSKHAPYNLDDRTDKEIDDDNITSFDDMEHWYKKDYLEEIEYES